MELIKFVCYKGVIFPSAGFLFKPSSVINGTAFVVLSI